MNKVNNNLLAALLLSFCLMPISGCKTENGAPVLDGDSLDITKEMDPAQDFVNIPLSLWSPAQRQANAGYYYLVAESMALRGELNKARSIYEAAYGLDPNPFLGAKVIAAKAGTNEKEQALLDARRMVLLYPKYSKLHFFYGQMLLDTGQLEQAEKEFEACISIDKTSEPCYINLVEMHHSLQNFPKAIVVANEMVTHNPFSLYGWTQLSRLYLTTNQPKKALTPAMRAFEMQTNNPHLTQMYAIVLQLNGQKEQAAALYEKLYRLNPTDEDLMGRMVDLYRELGNLETALSLIDELVAVSEPPKPGLLMQRAIILWELEKNQEAAKILAGLVTSYPESDRLKYMAGYGFERVKDLDRAEDFYKQISEASSFYYHSIFRRVVVMSQKKQHRKARDLAMTLITLPEAEWDAHALLGSVYADLEDYSKAVDTVDFAIEKYPDKYRLLFLKGVYQEKAGDIEDCIDTMRQVISKEPENSSAYNYLGYLFAERGENLDEAEKLIVKALSLKPGDGYYLDSLGWVYFQKGDLDKAQKVLKEALAKEPEEGVILEHLGDLALKRGNRPGASEYFERALKGKIEEKDKKRVQGKLNKLKDS